MIEIKIRDYELADKNYVLTHWLKGIYHGNHRFLVSLILNQFEFFQIYQKIVEEILARPNLQLKIACLPDDPDVILGYCAYEEDCIHYIYVKESFRNMGVATKLYPNSARACSHTTRIGTELSHKMKLKFKPVRGFNLSKEEIEKDES